MPPPDNRKALLSRLLIAGIRAYQWLLRPLLPPACRFHPTCSTYAIESVRRFGPARGSLLAIGRLLRCHPWNAGGLDPLPGPEPRASERHSAAGRGATG